MSKSMSMSTLGYHITLVSMLNLLRSLDSVARLSPCVKAPCTEGTNDYYQLK